MDTATTTAAVIEDGTGTFQVEHIDPAQAVVGINVRAEARLSPGFVASIRERGVLVPVVGHRDEQGRFVVLYGQRRILAAVETGRTSVPAYVIDCPEDVDRIIDQMAENDHREGINTADRIGGMKQLAAFGLTAAQIKRRTARPRDEVDAALTVARSELASKAAQRWDFLTLDQAATLAEFDNDPEAAKALTVAAREGHGFEHAAQQLRDTRDDAAARAAVAEKLTETGVRVVGHPDYDDKTVKDLGRLAAKPESRAYNKGTHATCPGHAAYVSIQQRWDKDEKGKQVRIRDAEPVYVCTDWRAQGHADLWDRAPEKRKASDMTPEQREAAKAERQDVIQSNKAWDTAEPVRRQWLATFVTRKVAPKGAAAFLAHVLTEHSAVVHDMGGDHLAAEWFGLKPAAYGITSGWGKVIEQATEQRAQVIAVARLLSALEKNTSRDSWRRVSPATALYMGTIAAWGYDLAEVEKRAAGLVPTKAARRPRASAAPVPEQASDQPDTEQPGEAPTVTG